MTPTVLIADDDHDLVNLLTLRCQSLGLRVVTAHDAITALVRIEEHRPDVAILDVTMPRGDGLNIAETLAGDKQLASMPVVVLTGSETEQVARRCFDLCLYYVPKCPDVWSRVDPLLRELLEFDTQADDQAEAAAPTTPAHGAGPPEGATDRRAEGLVDSVFAVIGVEEGDSLSPDDPLEDVGEERPWVLSIEDDEDVALALKLRLEEFGVTVIHAGAGAEGYRKAFFAAPRAILLDYELPEGNGEYVLRRLKQTPGTAEIPVIMLTGRREKSLERRVLGLGAEAFLNKPFNWRQVRETLEPFLAAPALAGV